MDSEVSYYGDVEKKLDLDTFWGGVEPVKRKGAEPNLFSNNPISKGSKRLFKPKGLPCGWRPDYVRKNVLLDHRRGHVIVEVKAGDNETKRREAQKQARRDAEAILDVDPGAEFVIAGSLLWQDDCCRLETWWVDRRSEPRLIEKVHYSGGHSGLDSLGWLSRIQGEMQSLAFQNHLSQEPTLTSFSERKELVSFLEARGWNQSKVIVRDKRQDYNGKGDRKCSNAYAKELREIMLTPELCAFKVLKSFLDRGDHTREQANTDKELFRGCIKEMLAQKVDVHIVNMGGSKFSWIVFHPNSLGDLYAWKDSQLVNHFKADEINWKEKLLSFIMKQLPKPAKYDPDLWYVKLKDIRGKRADSLEVYTRRVVCFEEGDIVRAQKTLKKTFNSKYELSKDKKIKAALKRTWNGKPTIPYMPLDLDLDVWYPQGCDRDAVRSYYENVKRKYPTAAVAISLGNANFGGKGNASGVSKHLVIGSGTVVVDVYDSEGNVVGTRTLNPQHDIDGDFLRKMIYNEMKECKQTDGQIYNNISVASIMDKAMIPLFSAAKGTLLSNIEQRMMAK